MVHTRIVWGLEAQIGELDVRNWYEIEVLGCVRECDPVTKRERASESWQVQCLSVSQEQNVGYLHINVTGKNRK